MTVSYKTYSLHYLNYANYDVHISCKYVIDFCRNAHAKSIERVLWSIIKGYFTSVSNVFYNEL